MIETPRTIIRPYAEADIALIAPIFADPITMGFWPQPFSEDATAAWVRRAGRSFRELDAGYDPVEERQASLLQVVAVADKRNDEQAQRDERAKDRQVIQQKVYMWQIHDC